MTYCRGDQSSRVLRGAVQEPTVVVINGQKLYGWSKKKVRDLGSILVYHLKGNCETLETPSTRPEEVPSIFTMADGAAFLKAGKPNIRICSLIDCRRLWTEKQVPHEGHISCKSLS